MESGTLEIKEHLLQSSEEFRRLVLNIRLMTNNYRN